MARGGYTSAMLRKILSRLGASLAASIMPAFIMAHAALADTYPSRPIRWIVAYPPGGTSDIIDLHVVAI